MSGATNRMTSAQVQAFLDAPRHAIAAVLRPGGAPQLSPIWFLYEDKRLYFSIGLDSAKYRQLSRDPRLNRTLAEVEAEYFRKVLESVDGNKTQAAKILGIDRKTLREKLKKADPESD